MGGIVTCRYPMLVVKT
ncbi:hypothetical protein ACLB1N_15380 [Escherichia coli]